MAFTSNGGWGWNIRIRNHAPLGCEASFRSRSALRKHRQDDKPETHTIEFDVPHISSDDRLMRVPDMNWHVMSRHVMSCHVMSCVDTQPSPVFHLGGEPQLRPELGKGIKRREIYVWQQPARMRSRRLSFRSRFFQMPFIIEAPSKIGRPLSIRAEVMRGEGWELPDRGMTTSIQLLRTGTKIRVDAELQHLQLVWIRYREGRCRPSKGKWRPHARNLLLYTRLVRC